MAGLARYAVSTAAPILGRSPACRYTRYSGSLRGWNFALNACSEPNPYSGSISLPSTSSTRWIGLTVPFSDRTSGAPDSDTRSAPSDWNVTHASAIRNSTTGRNPSALRRIMSSVQPRGLPFSSRIGSHDVTPWTVPSASTAMPTRTLGSMASLTPPRVKPSSGVRLPFSHAVEISRT